MYDPDGTNGELKLVVCNTIELPWLQNQRRVSCIPEGRYELIKRVTKKRGQHLLVLNVKGRDGILIHPANDAKKELLGCIAPVTTLTGPGKGTQSRLANEKLKALVLEALEGEERVFITIKSKRKMKLVERLKSPTPKFFRVLRNVGLALAAAGGALLTAPIALPAAAITVAGYLTVAGGVMTAVSQTAVDGEKDCEDDDS